MINKKLVASYFLLFFLIVSSTAYGQEEIDLKGRWNLVINKDNQQLPGWLEISKSGHKTLIGRFVYAFGSARPIAEVKQKDANFSFTIPTQWERGYMDMVFEGKKEGESLKGSMRYTDGKTYEWTATLAPKLTYHKHPVWGKPVNLFNKKSIDNWKVLGENQWVIEEGILKNQKSGGNLVTKETFTDFKLHVEFRYPKGSNSGIYLRGRYEVQIEDNQGKDPSSLYFAGVYGFLEPNEMAAKAPGEWQTYDITLNGRRVSVVANGLEVITNQNIPGITGGALDSKEGEPGPIMIQGDHGPIEFRKVVLTPMVKK